MISTSGARRQFPAAAAALVLVLASVRASGQTPAAAAMPAPASEAKTHFERGVTFYNDGDSSAALVEFKRAYSLAPTWQVLFNIGQSYFQTHDYAQALVTLRRFVEEGGGRVPPDRRALVDGELADLANRIGHASIASNIEGATITIDDRTVGTTPLREPVLVSAGERKIVATLAGRAPLEQSVSVPTGETVAVHFDFPELSAAPPATPAVEEQLSPAPSLAITPIAPLEHSPNRVPAIIAFGFAGAGAVVGAISGGLALHEKSTLNGECAQKACPSGSQHDIDTISRDATISTVGFGVAVAGAALGITLWATAHGSVDRGQRTNPASTVSVRLAPGFMAGTF